MLLQRLGRLWRHKNPDRNSSALREAWLLVPELKAAIENTDLFGNSAKVYSPYVLCRSLEIWHELNHVKLPTDIRKLIEATYVEREEVGKMRRYKAELEKKRSELNQLALFGLSKAGKTLPETASTRYSEQDGVQVLLIKAYRHNANNSETLVTLLDGTLLVLPHLVSKEDKKKIRDLAAQLLQQTMQVASYLAPQPVSIDTLKTWLGDYIYLGERDQTESLLRVAIVNESGEIKGLNGGMVSEKYQLSYYNHLGYYAEKTGTNK